MRPEGRGLRGSVFPITTPSCLGGLRVGGVQPRRSTPRYFGAISEKQLDITKKEQTRGVVGIILCVNK